MSFTLVAALREACRKLHEGERLYPLGTTTADGSATALVDGLLLADASRDTAYVGRPRVRIDSFVGGGPVSGEISNAAINGLVVATGTLTISPALTNIIKSGTDYSLWKLFEPRQALAMAQDLARGMRREVWIPVSALLGSDQATPDADMEDTTTNAWTALATTLSKDTTAANVRRGSQSLKCLTTNTVNSVQTASPILVNQYEQWMVSAAVKCGPGATVTMTVLDYTNGSAVIGSAAVSSQEDFVLLVPNSLVIVIPAGCREIIIKFSSGNAKGYWVDSLVAWNRNDQIFELPSYVDDPNDVMGAGYFPRGALMPGTNAFTLDEGNFQGWPFRKIVEEGGAHPFRLEFTGGAIPRPLWVRAGRPFTKPALDADSLTCEQDLFVDMLLFRIYMAKAEEAARRNDTADEQHWLARAALASDRVHRKEEAGRAGQDSFQVHYPRPGHRRGGGSRNPWGNR